MLIPNIGKVIIEEFAEISNNVCIESTVLRKNAKVDHLIHIADEIENGANPLIIAYAMIAGSVRLDQNTWIAPHLQSLKKQLLEMM